MTGGGDWGCLQWRGGKSGNNNLVEKRRVVCYHEKGKGPGKFLAGQRAGYQTEIGGKPLISL